MRSLSVVVSEFFVGRAAAAVRTAGGKEIVTRPADNGDLPSIQDLVRRSQPGGGHSIGCSDRWVPPWSGGEVTLVTTLQDRPHELAAVTRLTANPRYPDEVELTLLVAPACQGQGIGTLLAILATQVAHQAGYWELTATLLDSNVRMRRIFAHLDGREHHGRVPGVTGEGERVVILSTDAEEPRDHGALLYRAHHAKDGSGAGGEERTPVALHGSQCREGQAGSSGEAGCTCLDPHRQGDDIRLVTEESPCPVPVSGDSVRSSKEMGSEPEPDAFEELSARGFVFVAEAVAEHRRGCPFNEELRTELVKAGRVLCLVLALPGAPADGTLQSMARAITDVLPRDHIVRSQLREALLDRPRMLLDGSSRTIIESNGMPV